MRLFTAFFVFATLILSSLSPNFAQETENESVNIVSGQIKAIIIAPARSPIAKIIKKGLRSNYDAQPFESKSWYEAQKLYYFYGERYFEPLWISQDENGNAIFSEKAKEIISLFENAKYLGLNEQDYLTDEINLELAGNDPVKLAQLETAFSNTILKYAQHVYGGRINPRKVSASIDYKPNRINKSKILHDIINSDNPTEILRRLEPNHREYIALKKVLAKIYNGEIKQKAIIPDGKLIRLGDKDKRLPLIRERLGIKIADIEADIYDETLLAAVEKFQTKMGLSSDGVIGPATIGALNGASAASKEDIIANIERWRWMPRELGDFYVFVNIPEYRLYIMDNDEIAHTTRVIVGKPKFKTVIFSDEMEHIVVNPYWNIPRSIINNEIGPAIRANPNYLAAKNMELISGGKVVNQSKIDWANIDLNKFRIRQRPGAGNALGSVKFLFPNRHAIYLHDTPTKSLFLRSRRAFSHGCVRVKDPWDFAKALLKYEPKVKYSSLVNQRGINKGEKWNNVANHIPVHLAYFTIRVDENGNIRSYGDIYGHNERLKKLLAL